MQGHTEVVRVLFKHGVERHVRDKAIYYAAYSDEDNNNNNSNIIGVDIVS